MARLVFDAQDVKRVIEHALAAKEHQREMTDCKYNPETKEIDATYKDGTPAVLLVHDDGVYLMSNGTPRDIVEGDQEHGRNFAAYAKGCDPRKDSDWWDTARNLVGGDDFGETLHWCETLKRRIDGGAKQITINMSKNKVWL